MGGLDSAVAVKRKWTEDDQDQLNPVEALLDVHLGLPCHLPTFKQVQESRGQQNSTYTFTKDSDAYSTGQKFHQVLQRTNKQ
mmetsp:Transcript_19220/g.34209  ORF Transcript_19220/g.34209 Transcript_19220/m.34209 type:complete len:82 (-) Transcript_19220:1234-1479(-)